jgi:hypothetical protein
MTFQRQKQQVDIVVFIALWFLGMLFLRVPGDLLIAKMLCLTLAVCTLIILGLFSMWDQIVEGETVKK